MQLVKTLVVMFSILRLNFAAVNNCNEEDVKDTLCLKTNVNCCPLVVNTTIALKEIIEISEKESSITVRVTLTTLWRDPRVGLSNGSTM